LTAAALKPSAFLINLARGPIAEEEALYCALRDGGIGGWDRQDRGQGRGRKQLTGDRMTRQDARRMIVRRAKKAGLLPRIGCHSFRATGITVYLLNGGLLEYTRQMAAHESARTTKLYDRHNDQVTLDQVERIVL
jgi:integrase